MKRSLTMCSLLLVLLLVSCTQFASGREVERDVTVPTGQVVYGSVTLGLRDEGKGWVTALNGSVNTVSGVLDKLYVFSEENWYNFTHDLPFTVLRKVQNIGSTPKFFQANITKAGTWYIVLDNRGDTVNSKMVHFEFDYIYIRVVDGYYNLPPALKTQWVEYTVSQNSVAQWDMLWGGWLKNLNTGDVLRFEVVDLRDYSWKLNCSWVGSLFMRFLRNNMFRNDCNGTAELGIYALIVLPPTTEFFSKMKNYLENHNLGTVTANSENVTVTVNNMQGFYREVFDCVISWDGSLVNVYSRSTGILLSSTYQGFEPYAGIFSFYLSDSSKPALGTMLVLTLDQPSTETLGETPRETCETAGQTLQPPPDVVGRYEQDALSSPIVQIVVTLIVIVIAAAIITYLLRRRRKKVSKTNGGS